MSNLKINDEKLLSIIIPVYNVEEYLQLCLDSLLRNISKDAENYIEILIINDGSTDNSQTVINSYLEKESYIRAYVKQNGGLSDARNYGIQRSKGKYISFIDSDDIVNPEFINIVVSLLIQNEFDVMSFEFKKFFGMGTMTLESYSFAPKELNEHLHDADLDFYLDGALVAWNKIYSKKCFDEIQFTKGLYYEDVALVPLILDSAKAIKHLDLVLYGYRQRKGSITSQQDDKYMDLLKGVEFIYSKSTSTFIRKIIISQFFTLCLITLRLPFKHCIRNMKRISYIYINNFDFGNDKISFSIRNSPFLLLKIFGRPSVYLLLGAKPLIKIHLWLKNILSTFR